MPSRNGQPWPRLIEREFSEEGDLDQALDVVRGGEAIPRSRALAVQFGGEAAESIDWLAPSEPRSALEPCQTLCSAGSADPLRSYTSYPRPV